MSMAPRSHLQSAEWTLDTVTLKAAGTGESNKQMRRMRGEWQNAVYQGSAVSAL